MPADRGADDRPGRLPLVLNPHPHARHKTRLLARPILGRPPYTQVFAADGFTYERHAFEKWLQQSPTDQPTSPLTGERLSSRDLVPNAMARSLAHKLQRRLFDK